MKPETNSAADFREFQLRFKKELARTIHLRRREIIEKISQSVGKDLSRYSFYNYTSSQHKDNRFPAEWLPALIEVTGDSTILKMIAKAAGYELISKKDLVFVEIGQIEEQIRGLQKERIARRLFLQQIEKK